MENFLFAKNKFEFVDGTIEKPLKGAKDYMLWMRCEAMVKGWLTTAMEKNIRDSVKYANTTSNTLTQRLRYGMICVNDLAKRVLLGLMNSNRKLLQQDKMGPLFPLIIRVFVLFGIKFRQFCLFPSSLVTSAHAILEKRYPSSKRKNGCINFSWDSMWILQSSKHISL